MNATSRHCRQAHVRLPYALRALRPRLIAYWHPRVLDRTVTVPGATRDTEAVFLGSHGTAGNLAALGSATLDVTVP